MNLVAVVKFFYIIYKMILLSLFISEHYDKGLFRLVSTYFEIVKINNYNIFYLYYLIWLKKVLHLLILYTKIQENKDFHIRLLVFLEYIIKCSIKDNAFSDTLHHICFNICKVNITKDFMAQLKKNNKIIIKKV